MKRSWLWNGFAVVMLSIPVVAMVARAQRPKLPSFGSVPAFALVDQDKAPLTRAMLDGKVWVADFVFTGCSLACPRLTDEMARLQTFVAQRGDRVALVSFSVDPERDTPERLHAYAAGFHADTRQWKFVTGPAKQVEDAVVNGFKQGMTKEPDPDEKDGFSILHGTRFVLVDQHGEIRGFYDAQDAAEMAKLRTHLLQLLNQ
jgi:protein SCO1/2